METRDFSDLSKSYNKNSFLLNDARKVFETELRRMNDMISDFLSTAIERANQNEAINWKLKWQDVEDKSTQKDGPWLNFTTRTETAITVKTPVYKNFRKNVAYIIFETVFDWDDTNQFVLRCRFENENIVGEQLDEKLIELAQKNIEKYPGCQHFKASTAIVFKRELNADLLENLNKYVNETVELVTNMVSETFPDAQYPSTEQTNTNSDSAK